VALGFDSFGAGGALANSALRSGWGRQVALLWDAVETGWQTWVIGYGPDVQRALLESLGLEGLRRMQRSAVLLGLAAAATIALLLGLSGYLAWRQRRRTAFDPAASRFASFVRYLQRFEVPPRAPSEGPRAYAERAAGRLPHAAARIRGVVELYLRARYEPDADGEALTALGAEVAAFRISRTSAAS
jgi:hypothetical protein